MPRVARFRIEAVEELYRQLQYAPRETRLRQMNAAETLVNDIDPELNYPQEFVIFRITSYRSDRMEESVTFVGRALVGDLVNLVQRISDGLDLSAEEVGREPTLIEDVARQLNVSTKTVQRYRRQGLLCHYVVFPDGVKRLACFSDAVQRFVDRYQKLIARAAAFTRIDKTVELRIIEEARQLHRTEDLTLNETALRLSRDHRRAHETMRAMLLRHDRRSASPIFTEHGPLDDRDARLIHRAWRLGVATGTLARRFGKTPATIRRAYHRRQSELLRTFEIPVVRLPTFELDEAESVILSNPAVTGGLDDLLPRSDVVLLIRAAAAAPAPEENTEHALVAGSNILSQRATMRINALPAWPASAQLDAIETDLRWATTLKRRLVSSGMPAAIRRIEQNLHHPLTSQPAERIIDLLMLAATVVSRVVDDLDPSRGQRLERRVAYEMDRALAGAGRLPAAGRAAVRHEPGAVRMPDIFSGLTRWERLLCLRPDLRELVPTLSEPLRHVVSDHYGLGSTPPRTRTALAEELGISPTAVARLLRRAELSLRTRVREESRR